ncbi:MAG TPA: hypothetical protein VGX49_13225 [Jatrophihabitans sp.]|jgi:hypothetical protein|nr:hypothetical protein [Jatrophihabitans sp.]
MTDLRQLCLPLAVLAAVGLSACAGSSKNATAPQKATGTTSTASSSVPAPSPSPTLLTKAEFVAKMDAVCVDFTTKFQQLPDPMDADDYVNIAASVDGTLKLFPAFIKQAEALVGRSADKATLTDNWLSIEKADFAAVEPGLKRFLVDLKAKNQAKIVAEASALECSRPQRNDRRLHVRLRIEELRHPGAFLSEVVLGEPAGSTPG